MIPTDLAGKKCSNQVVMYCGLVNSHDKESVWKLSSLQKSMPWFSGNTCVVPV